MVWAINAEMGQGAVQAIDQMGYTGKIHVFDFDASSDDISAIESGALTGTIAQYPNLQAEAAIQACLADGAVSLRDGVRFWNFIYGTRRAHTETHECGRIHTKRYGARRICGNRVRAGS